MTSRPVCVCVYDRNIKAATSSWFHLFVSSWSFYSVSAEIICGKPKVGQRSRVFTFLEWVFLSLSARASGLKREVSVAFISSYHFTDISFYKVFISLIQFFKKANNKSVVHQNLNGHFNVRLLDKVTQDQRRYSQKTWFLFISFFFF